MQSFHSQKSYFFFREVKNNHFNINTKINDIKNIINLTDCFNHNYSTSITGRNKNLADIKLENREVNIYNIDKNIEMISKEVLGINDVKSN